MNHYYLIENPHPLESGGNARLSGYSPILTKMCVTI